MRRDDLIDRESSAQDRTLTRRPFSTVLRDFSHSLDGRDRQPYGDDWQGRVSLKTGMVSLHYARSEQASRRTRHGGEHRQRAALQASSAFHRTCAYQSAELRSRSLLTPGAISSEAVDAEAPAPRRDRSARLPLGMPAREPGFASSATVISLRRAGPRSWRRWPMLAQDLAGVLAVEGAPCERRRGVRELDGQANVLTGPSVACSTSTTILRARTCVSARICTTL